MWKWDITKKGIYAILTYGVEARTWTRTDISRLTAAE